MGTLGFQGSIKWWTLRHRLHHRYTDDNVNDPYSAKKGFWFSHMGWIFEKPVYPRMKMVDAKDLNEDPIVAFQHKYYPYLALFSGFVVPTVIAALWGDALGGYLYGGFFTRIIVWHCTFCINSFAHWIGEQNFSTEMSARGTLLLALFTNGEGHHNFHHEFPKDYRNGIETLDWDPTKWLIAFCAKIGLASDLYMVPDNEIKKARILTAEIKAAELRKQVNWGPEPSSLPSLPAITNPDSVTTKLGHDQWFILDGFVLDVKDFLAKHPGGEGVLLGYLRKDASKGFYGNLNTHSLSARTFVRMLRVGRVDEV
ncbi:hypothetical protein HDU76_012630 [Blyttiomyces sp. JEL0837]|nr:hypothetical protein HDU76_012630 [Blyttiomyces sp. JEL0837]